MSLINVAAECEYCGRKTFDYMDDGWIVCHGLTWYSKRDNYRYARSKKFLSESSAGHYFCSPECLLGVEKLKHSSI